MLACLKKMRKTVMALGRLALLASMLVIFSNVWRIYYPATSFYPDHSFWQKGNLVMVFLYGSMLLLLIYIYNASKIGTLKFTELTYSLLLTIVIANSFSYVQICLMARALVELSPIALMSLLQFVTVVLITYLFHRLYFILYPAQRVLVVCAAGGGDADYVEKIRERSMHYQIGDVAGDHCPMHEIKTLIARNEAVMLGTIDVELRSEILIYCGLIHKPVYFVPAVGDIMVKTAQQIQLSDTPLYYCENTGLSPEGRFLKRTLDLCIAAPIFLLTAPLFILLALLIKLEDGGPAFYRQKRLTLHGKEFSILKFRSMVVNAEADGAQFAGLRDARVTKVGRILRKVRLDELPQLLNILQGDMSIVGPRPERPEFSVEFERENPLFRMRLQAKAGLTGYAQIYGRYNTSPENKLLLDLSYIKSFSLLLDLKLIFMTVRILFIPESTQGVPEGDGRGGRRRQD